MRLDKFLKVSRIIKRRTVANEACDNAKILLNGRQAKASAEVHEGDTIEVAFFASSARYKVLSLSPGIGKAGAEAMAAPLENQP